MKSKRNRFRTLLASCLIVCADYTYGNPGDFTALQNAINEAQEYIASHASSYTGAIVALYQDEVNIAQDLANEGKVNQNAIDRQLENLASARTALEATE